jgi:hypothetical protein
MKKLCCLLLLAFASFAIPSYAERPTVITSLPFIITTPGTYVLAGDLSSTVANVDAIQISTATSGPVIVDLKGFTLNRVRDQFWYCHWPY